tara:strand:+ start:4311 stop:4766 length:456 start_codon:yes stop_codon:yes gene_type:complete
MAGQRFWIVLSAAGLLMLDQLSKQSWLRHLEPGVSHRWIPGLLNLRLVWNDGAAFSLFRNGSAWLAWISLLVSVGLLIWIWSRGRQWSRWQASAAAFLLAGSVGNGIDRWRYGAVIDGLELVPFSFPVFNLADVAINLAVLCLLVDAIQRR